MRELLGLPVNQAAEILKDRGIPCCITRYEAKRELENADDWRVVRCAIKNGAAEIVACRFVTEFADENA